MIWGDNCTDPILLIDTKWPLGRVIGEFDVGTDETKEDKEQQTWWVAPVSNTQAKESRKLGKKTEEKENVSLKLETDGPGYCNSGVAGMLPWNWELKRVMSCWHWAKVSKVSGESFAIEALVVQELVWFCWALAFIFMSYLFYLQTC